MRGYSDDRIRARGGPGGVVRAVARTGGAAVAATGREGGTGAGQPAAAGGAGGAGPAGAVFASGALDLCLLRESLAYGCTEAETALALQGLGAYPVLRAGSEEQRERWLPQVRAGRAVAAFALSEPGAGS
ncbi:acyl-CoA dehydrogenase family protein [Streptomyces sp. NRRL S-448]|uniref:acyl-CoA dehydrogenase family protein n=1 Tax=Streptomyces sp. NRRL S-448 TaxID=1463907 RepID=UPI00356A2833